MNAPAQTPPYTFFIQDRWGVIVGLTMNESGIVHEAEIVRGMVESFAASSEFVDLEVLGEKGYQLTSEGRLISMGQAQLPRTFWPPVARSSRLAVAPDDSGLWLAINDHIVVRGSPPPVVLPPQVHQRKRVTDLDYEAPLERLVVLFEDGTITLCYPNTVETLQTLQLEHPPTAVEKNRALEVESTPEGFLVLTQNAQVYLVRSDKAVQVQDTPDLGRGLARDIEPSPFGEGFYLLDTFGVIHACSGALAIPTEPLPQDSAVDLEIAALSSPPKWRPSGWNTKARLQPQNLLLDPIGQARFIDLIIDHAENISGFIAELRYDPSLIRIHANQAQIGKWWEQNIQGALVQANLDTEKGVLLLSGGGSVLPYTGASGSGEIAKLSVSATGASNAAADQPKTATTSLTLTNFHFRDVYPGDQYRPAQVVHSTTITIQPIFPNIFARWHKAAAQPLSVITAKPGDIVRAELIIENGSRVKAIEFDFRFSNSRLTYLGTNLGPVWDHEVPLQVNFGIPKWANEQGGLSEQKIAAPSAGACRDKRGEMAVFYFAVNNRGEGNVTFEKIQAIDNAGRRLDLDLGDLTLQMHAK